MYFTNKLYKTVTKLLLDLEEFAYLYSLYLDEDWGNYPTTESMNKMKTLGFLDRAGNLTNTFYVLVTELEGGVETDEDEFEKFWKAYPLDNSFGRFESTRVIRTNRDESKLEFTKARLRYGLDVIIEGLKAYYEYLKKTSYTENKVTYMKGPSSFLKSKTFLDYEVAAPARTVTYGTDLA